MDARVCGRCGTALDEAGFRYVRQEPDRIVSRGYWRCVGCETPYYPNEPPQGIGRPAAFSQSELDRLLVFTVLHSNEGFGTRFRDDGKIACWLPVPLSLLEQAAVDVLD